MKTPGAAAVARSTLYLSMIVKNEARVIGRCLEHRVRINRNRALCFRALQGT